MTLERGGTLNPDIPSGDTKATENVQSFSSLYNTTSKKFNYDPEVINKDLPILRRLFKEQKEKHKKENYQKSTYTTEANNGIDNIITEFDNITPEEREKYLSNLKRKASQRQSWEVIDELLTYHYAKLTEGWQKEA